MIAAAVDTTALLKMVYSSLIAGVGVAVIFSLAVLGGTRFGERRREDRTVASVAYGTLAVLATLAAIGIVVYGLVLITHKS